MRIFVSIAVAAVLAGCAPDVPRPEPATLVLRNGVVATLEPAAPIAEAVAIRGDVIAMVGTDRDVERLIGPDTEVIDLAGQFAMPGFIEGHGHLMNLGQSKTTLDLTGAASWNDIVRMVGDAAATAAPGTWILGRGWHQEKWNARPVPGVEGFPVHDALSTAAPGHPVLLTHASGHAAIVNARAMELAGITSTTPNPPGGDILKDGSGRPTGLLRETAAGLAQSAYQLWVDARSDEENRAERDRRLELAVQEALANGVTSFQDAGSDFETIDFFKQALAQGDLGIRLYVMVRDSNDTLRARLPSEKALRLGDNRLTVAAIKKTMDGALGSRGAWMLEPYADLPGHVGLNTIPVAELEEAARLALDNGVQLNVHAIGDRANRTVLDVYEAAFRSRPELTDLRWRIEHAQHLSLTDMPRLAQLGVIASMQAIHATSDAPFVIERLGARRARDGAYVWRTLIQSGAIVSNGTDTPVEPINPIANFHAAVTRESANGSPFFPDQRMTREEALRAATWNAAFAAKEDDIKGSLTRGKLADVTVLSKDILTVPEDEILSTAVTYTIVGGKVVYRGDGNRE
ncbi:MAG: amidohydrolase [Vicinamibacterales bacterium]